MAKPLWRPRHGQPLAKLDKQPTGSVSAVVSDMVNKRKELEPAEESTYRLTESGRLAWAAIKHSPKYVNRAVSATLQ